MNAREWAGERTVHIDAVRTDPEVSLVVPVYNEEDNILPLVEQVRTALACMPRSWELVLVDDGSSDGSARQMRAVTGSDARIRAVMLSRNFGQTAAMQAGIDAAVGEVIVTLDGDLQNDPADIPRMVERLVEEDLDLLVGWRTERKDNVWLRRIPSWLANRLIGAVTGLRLHDYGCSLKVFRASVIRQVRLYGEMHRFIPAWMATLTSPARIREEPVGHAARVHGSSKYGLSRTFKVLLDLVSVYFFIRYRSRPGHFFGRIGFLFGAAGVGILAWLSMQKLLYDIDIGSRPLLMLGLLLTVSGVQLVCTGIVTELLARTYFESSGARTYVVRSVAGGSAALPAARREPVQEGGLPERRRQRRAG